MLGIFNGIATLLVLATFLGIVWWAWSAGRAKANHEASMLPFALPDEAIACAATQKNEGHNHE
ncbi:CcoQ/FixQ family Cbb3-type cytochrome c oxidase assembly chaperone [Pusillimonas sp. TS35]|uniref:cbb3-type cytochrome oxidase subunit 3 n=1 Tax=Paracandidimonas lactea TaxID=2895524 RepID=UPI00136C8052|nr:CcoQ/FixQ family Cbb3-type cytochrome c oxidase assembly chaperone [Paracandidimonas lactea]MYN11894.1 CcoQ/FixQ family Cbb3-type cytochrome c oxidase assembly chaperone [Pusillimonas sp. TS35]